jgi:hypothetical protein
MQERVSRIECKNQAQWAYKLICKQDDRLEAKFAIASSEKVFQRRAEKFNYKGLVVAFCAIPIDRWDSSGMSQSLVDVELSLKGEVIHVN